MFIFNGRPKPLLLDTRPSQVIRASQFSPASLRGFGISFSRGVDVDDNEVPDIAVGAHNSNNAVILRSHPVIEFEGEISFSRNYVNAALSRFSMTVTVRYRKFLEMALLLLIQHLPFSPKKFVQKSVSSVKARVTVMLDKNTQLVNDPDRDPIEYEVRIPVGRKSERSFDVIVNSESLSSSTASIKMSATVAQVHEDSYSFCRDCGVARDVAKFSSEIPFQTGCRRETCQSDLSLEVFIPEMENEPYFVIGSTSKLKVGIIVNNLERREGETSYKPTISIKYPTKLKLFQLIADANCVDNQLEKNIICQLQGPITPGNYKKYKLF